MGGSALFACLFHHGVWSFRGWIMRNFGCVFVLGYPLLPPREQTSVLSHQPLSRKLHPFGHGIIPSITTYTDRQSIRVQLKLHLRIWKRTGTVCGLVDAREGARAQVFITHRYSSIPSAIIPDAGKEWEEVETNHPRSCDCTSHCYWGHSVVRAAAHSRRRGTFARKSRIARMLVTVRGGGGEARVGGSSWVLCSVAWWC